jgi:hypothetical protein
MFKQNLPYHSLLRTKEKLHILKGKDVPVIGLEGPQGCERLRLPHLLDNRLTDGGKFVSLTPQESSWYSFLLEAESTPGP